MSKVPSIVVLAAAFLLSLPLSAQQDCGPSIKKDEVQTLTLRAHEASILPELVRQSGFEIAWRQDHVDARQVSKRNEVLWGPMAKGGGVLDEKAQRKRLAKGGCHGGILVIHSSETVAGQSAYVQGGSQWSGSADRNRAQASGTSGLQGQSQLETETIADVTEYGLRRVRPDARLLPPEAIVLEPEPAQPEATSADASGSSGIEAPTAEQLEEIIAGAEAGDPESQLWLGFFHIEGLGVPVDPLKARTWVERAAHQGFGYAQYILGSMYVSGTAVPVDYVYAHSWLNLAASLGVEDARRDLPILEESMTPEQIAEAQKIAREFRAQAEE